MRAMTGRGLPRRRIVEDQARIREHSAIVATAMRLACSTSFPALEIFDET
jgi:hypothetical protein